MIKKYNLVEFLPLFLMFCVGIYLLPLRIMGLDLSWIPGDLVDGRLNNYFLEHGYKWITGQVQSFWDAPFFYPVVRTMSFSDNHLGTLPIYSIFRFLHFDRETAYQLWFIAVFALDYISCAWVLRRFSISGLGAAAGAFIFSFSLPIVAQIDHSQLLPRFMIPLAFYFALQYLERQTATALSLLCLTVVIQFYCTIYMGVFLVLGLLFLFIAYSLTHRDTTMLREIYWCSWRSFTLKFAVLFIAFLLLLPLMLPYYKTSLEYGMRSWGEIETMLPRIESYFLPPDGSFLWNWLIPREQMLPMWQEHQIFIGGIPLMSVLCMPFFYRLYRSERLMQLGMLMFVVLMLLISLTLYHGITLYRELLWLPGLKSIRAVTRIMLMNAFPISVITGIILTKIFRTSVLLPHKVLTISVTFILLSAVAADQYINPAGFYRYSKCDAQNRSKAVEQMILKKRFDTKLFVYMPHNSADKKDLQQLDAMMAAQHLNIATINGHSGIWPPSYYLDDDGSCDSYQLWKVAAINKYAEQDSNCSLFTDVVFVGHDVCIDIPHTYTYMSSALLQDGYKAEITFPNPRITVAIGQVFTVSAIVKNNGSATWRSLNDKNGEYQIKLSYRWLSGNHRPLSGFDTRRNISYDVAPGEKASLSFAIVTPNKPGIYFLEFDMVQEGITWFHDQGSPTSLLQINVL